MYDKVLLVVVGRISDIATVYSTVTSSIGYNLGGSSFSNSQLAIFKNKIKNANAYRSMQI